MLPTCPRLAIFVEWSQHPVILLKVLLSRMNLLIGQFKHHPCTSVAGILGRHGMSCVKPATHGRPLRSCISNRLRRPAHHQYSNWTPRKGPTGPTDCRHPLCLETVGYFNSGFDLAGVSSDSPTRVPSLSVKESSVFLRQQVSKPCSQLQRDGVGQLHPVLALQGRIPTCHCQSFP